MAVHKLFSSKSLADSNICLLYDIIFCHPIFTWINPYPMFIVLPFRILLKMQYFTNVIAQITTKFISIHQDDVLRETVVKAKTWHLLTTLWPYAISWFVVNHNKTCSLWMNKQHAALCLLFIMSVLFTIMFFSMKLCIWSLIVQLLLFWL